MRLKSLVRIDPAARAGERDQLGVDLGHVGDVVLDDLDRRRRFLLHPVEDLEATPAAIAAQRVRAVGDVLQLVEHEPRDDQRAVDEAGLDDLGDPAVDDRARVDDDARVARLAPGGSPADGRRTRPDRLGGDQQVAPLGHGQADHAEAEEDRDAERQPGPERRRQARTAGSPSSRPISRPSSRPTTAVTNSAVDSASTCRISQRRGTDREVRQDREADDDPGDDPRGQQGAGVLGRREQARRRTRRGRGRRGSPSAAPRRRM